MSQWMNPDTGVNFNYGKTPRSPLAGAGIGSMIGQGLYGVFGNPKDPMKSANKYFEQAPGQLHPYYDPYVNAGQQALPSLQNQFQSLMNDPTALMTSIGTQFKPSPGYQFNYDQSMQAANNAAAAGGMLGSPQHQQQASTIASGLANQDYYNYIDRAMKDYMTGIGGMSDINQQGFNASTDLGSMLASLLMNQGQLAYQGVASKNAADVSNAGGIGGFLGAAASMLGFK